ncbi:hypothetical protein [Streptomyces sp. NPDC003781]|uniref:hypothetical protein n=1 Tax=Streptomyces sp. NPDC003781 TaxID=3364686 RepID=UPI0036A58C8F
MSNAAQAREAAIQAIIASQKADRAGRTNDPAHRKVVPAIDKAKAAGCNMHELSAEADRRYGQWLVNNAGR